MSAWEPTTSGVSKKRILLVDDEEDVIKVVGGRLAQWGYEPVTAANGQAALAAVNQWVPDLILLDLKMPVLNGKEVCDRLKSDPRFSKIPIILLTASSPYAADEELRAVRADDCVLKPFEPEELLATIRKWTG